MAIWGSLIGGMIGLSLGGPFGMLLGSLIGGKISRAKSRAGFGSFAQPQQIAQIYKGNINVLDEVINILFYIAEADGNVSDSEFKMIEHIAQIFGLSEIQFNSIVC